MAYLLLYNVNSIGLVIQKQESLLKYSGIEFEYRVADIRYVTILSVMFS